ncbi:MAG: phosphohydrolase [Sporichthyaceae bacterium]
MSLDLHDALAPLNDLRPLPADAVQVLHEVAAPPRLAAHLRLVHDVAAQLVEALAGCVPGLDLDGEAVLIDAATHGMPDPALDGGSEGERAVHLCIDESLRRYAAESADWMELDVSVEDLVVFLADKIWKGHRESSLEAVAVDRIGADCGMTPAQAFAAIDPVLTRLAADGDRRVAFQASYPLA